MFSLGRTLLISSPVAFVLGGTNVRHVGPAPEVTFTITSVEPGRSVQFEAQALGADLKRAIHIDRAGTPYTLHVLGREAYAVFHQLGGPGLLRVEVRPTMNREVASEAHTILFVVRGDSAGATISRW